MFGILKKNVIFANVKRQQQQNDNGGYLFSDKRKIFEIGGNPKFET